MLNYLELNASKSEILVFDGGDYSEEEFYYRGVELARSERFKYLSVWLEQKGG